MRGLSQVCVGTKGFAPSPARRRGSLVLELQAPLGGEVRGQVHHVLGREVLHLLLHDGILALAVLVVLERGLEVVGMLAREVREFGAYADAGLAVARRAFHGLGLLLADLGIARCRRGREDKREKRRSREDAGRHGAPHFFSAGPPWAPPQEAARSSLCLSDR